MTAATAIAMKKVTAILKRAAKTQTIIATKTLPTRTQPTTLKILANGPPKNSIN